jgi:two-component system response regulator
MYNCSHERMNPHTILVVEDDPNDENLTLRALRGLSVACSVVVARSGHEALDFLLRQGNFLGRTSANPDIVFLDNTLPGIGGNELVTKIRQREELNAVPLVVFSGTSDQTLINRCIAAGASGFVEKPLELSEYISTLRKTAEHWLVAAKMM